MLLSDLKMTLARTWTRSPTVIDGLEAVVVVFFVAVFGQEDEIDDVRVQEVGRSVNSRLKRRAPPFLRRRRRRRSLATVGRSLTPRPLLGGHSLGLGAPTDSTTSDRRQWTVRERVSDQVYAPPRESVGEPEDTPSDLNNGFVEHSPLVSSCQ